MSENRTFKIRVTYSKSGRLAMLSHLEVARALERCIRRAALPYAVSQGFSPHMKIAFGAALPVGVGSTCEIFDLTLTEYIAPQRVLAALQASSPADLMPSDASYLAAGSPAATVAFPVGCYRATVDWGGNKPETLSVPEKIVVARKKGDKTYCVADYLEDSPAIQGNDIFFSLRSRDTGALRADVFIRSCLESISCMQIDHAQEPEQSYNDMAPKVVEITRIAQKAC